MVAVVAGMFAYMVWPIALLVLSAINAAAAVGLAFTARRHIAGWSFATCALILATLYYTDWGVSRPNGTIQIAWPILVAACIAQVITVSTWLLAGTLAKTR